MNNRRVIFQSKQCEQITQEWFSVLGKVDKIPTSKLPTYDLKVDSERLLIEVKLINSENRLTQDRRTQKLPFFNTSEMSSYEFFNKMVEAVAHIKKDASCYPTYYRGGIIFWDTLFNFRQYPPTFTNFTASFPFDYEIFDNVWDFLILCEEPSIGDRPPAFIYIKKRELVSPLHKVFEKLHYIMYVLINDQFSQIKPDYFE